VGPAAARSRCFPGTVRSSSSTTASAALPAVSVHGGPSPGPGRCTRTDLLCESEVVLKYDSYGEDPSVEEEHADRVYVPGTNPTPPDRDVEPLWDDEVEAPVHGRPVPHQA